MLHAEQTRQTAERKLKPPFLIKKICFF